MNRPIEVLEEALGYRFGNRELLERALTHRSWALERSAGASTETDNEQLEFLGDAVLGFLASEALVRQHPSAREGRLSKWKAHLVSATHLYECALELGLGKYLLLGKGEERNGGRERKTLLANALEAVIAAIALDGGIEAARSFVGRYVLKGLENPDASRGIASFNHKSDLQERAQALGLPAPRYFIVASSGPEHAKVFTVEARINQQLATRGTGSSKKAASQRAAQLLSKLLDEKEAELPG
jgi:ribonuclease-3